MFAKRCSYERAFTLVELMVVVVILGILASAILYNVVGKSEMAKRTKAKVDIATIENLLDLFYLDMNRYPITEEGLDVLYHPSDEDQEKWKGPYAKKPIGKDPWGNPYLYECPGIRSGMPYEVMSLGRDGEEGGEGDDADITSWVAEEGEE